MVSIGRRDNNMQAMQKAASHNEAHASDTHLQASAKPKKRIAWLDIAKGFAIILVIFGHTLVHDSEVRILIYAVNMPIFFILAGYTMRAKPWAGMLKQSARRLLLPYTVLFVLMFGIKLLTGATALTPDWPIQELGCYIFGSGMDVWAYDGSHIMFPSVQILWFLMALFVSRVILNAILKIAVFCHARFERIPDLAISGIISLVIAWLGMIIGSDLGMQLPFSLDVGMAVTFLMWCGYAFKRLDLQRYLGKWWVLVGALVIYLGASNLGYIEFAIREYDNLVMGVGAELFGTLFFCSLSKFLEDGTKFAVVRPIEALMEWIGRNSMLIYAIHALDWTISWNDLAEVVDAAHHRAIGGTVRVLYDVGIAWVVKELV